MARNKRGIDNPYGSSPLGPDTSERGLPRYSQELPADTDTEQNGVGPDPTLQQSVPEMTVPDVRESPRDLEEGPIQTVPDVRESPDDPIAHIVHQFEKGVEEREEQESLQETDNRHRAHRLRLAINENFTAQELNSDMRAGFDDFIASAVAYGYSDEEIMAELQKREVYETLGLQPLGHLRSKGPDPFGEIRMRRERAAQEAIRQEEDRMSPETEAAGAEAVGPMR